MSSIRTYEITHSEQKPLPIKQKDTTDYLLGGSLVMKNGKIDKVLFDGGYAQASAASATTDKFAFNFYNQDHLGNNREVVDAKGVVQQVTNYYPFGAPYADATAIMGAAVQPYKYNGKELDLMHGLNTYDYGARQHDPILARWDRIDPLCEKYYNVSPYNYCLNNPVKFIDPNGKATYVIDNGNGTYTTIGKGVLNKDRNIYICTLDKKGNISKIGESIGQSLTTRSFVNSKDEFVKGAIINPNDKSGQSFLKKMENTGLYDYMWNATGGKPYDFKKTNGTEKVIGESTEYVYRGMKINTRGRGRFTHLQEMSEIMQQEWLLVKNRFLIKQQD